MVDDRVTWLASMAESSPADSHEDGWGFTYPTALADAIDHFESGKWKAVRMRREVDFETRLAAQPDFDKWKPGILKKACRNGLPVSRRKQVWLYLLGVKQVMTQGYYAGLLAQGEIDSKLARVIQADLRRTFPACSHFKDERVLVKLRNVLFAFAVSHKEVGYCQGLNFVCGVLLLVFGGVEADEEELFYAFCQLIDSGDPAVGLNVRGYYEPRMQLVLSDLDSLQRLLEKVGAGSLAGRLKQGDLTTLLCSEWLHACFSTAFPFPVVLRIWDALICEGWKVLFRVAAATIRLVTAPAALVFSEEELLTHHKRLTRSYVDHEALIHEAFHNLGNVRRSELRPLSRSQTIATSISQTNMVKVSEISLEDMNLQQNSSVKDGPVSINNDAT